MRKLNQTAHSQTSATYRRLINKSDRSMLKSTVRHLYLTLQTWENVSLFGECGHFCNTLTKKMSSSYIFFQMRVQLSSLFVITKTFWKENRAIILYSNSTSIQITSVVNKPTSVFPWSLIPSTVVLLWCSGASATLKRNDFLTFLKIHLTLAVL